MNLFGVVDLPLWSVLMLLCVALLYIYGSYPMRTWKRLGVPGPNPLPFIGNVHQLYSMNQVSNSRAKICKEYGKICGMYFFRQADLQVADLEALKEVFVKEFNFFSDRYHIGGGSFIQPCVRKSLFFSNGMDWKRQRRIVSPSFTSGKLKLLTHYVNNTARQLSDKLEQHAKEGTRVQAKHIFGAFTLDVIGGTAFGLDLDTHNNMDGPFFQNANGLFKLKALLKFAMGAACIFPFLGYILHKMNIAIIDDNCVKFYKDQITKLVMDRKTNPERFKQADFLQLLLDAEMDPSEDVVGGNKLSTDEVISQGILFLMAGFETTSTSLQFISYMLCKHQDVQDRLLEEIDDVVGGTEDVSYEMCQNLKYMEAVINETLRMYPPIATMNRYTTKATTLKGYTIPADTMITIDIFSIGRDPETYDNPDTFNPDRFMNGDNKASTHSIGFIPFGFGPRQCIGMRLAMMEIKIAVVYMLRRVALVDATPNDLELNDLTGMLSAKIPIELDLITR